VIPGGGQPNLQDLLKQAQKMQQQMETVQQELADAEVTGAAGGGLVTATMSGSGELIGLKVDPKVVDPDDIETLTDLVVAAVRAASEEANKLRDAKVGPALGGFGGGGLPGLGL
jgi:nucleoid-associated protein EbfC